VPALEFCFSPLSWLWSNYPYIRLLKLPYRFFLQLSAQHSPSLRLSFHFPFQHGGKPQVSPPQLISLTLNSDFITLFFLLSWFLNLCLFGTQAPPLGTAAMMYCSRNHVVALISYPEKPPRKHVLFGPYPAIFLVCL